MSKEELLKEFDASVARLRKDLAKLPDAKDYGICAVGRIDPSGRTPDSCIVFTWGTDPSLFISGAAIHYTETENARVQQEQTPTSEAVN